MADGFYGRCGCLGIRALGHGGKHGLLRFTRATEREEGGAGGDCQRGEAEEGEVVVFFQPVHGLVCGRRLGGGRWIWRCRGRFGKIEELDIE